MLNQAQIEKLLGRSLTANESSNFTLYLKIATQRLEELLCMNLKSDASERTYETRKGYRAVYVDPFTELNSVTIDDEVVDEDDYTIKQNDNLNASWYNIIEFDTVRRGQKIVVDADWGFGSCPTDLQLVLAKLFDQGSVEQLTDNTVQSKKIEDFTVTYKDGATFDEWILANQSIVDKYSHCNQGYIRHGRIRPIYHY